MTADLRRTLIADRTYLYIDDRDGRMRGRFTFEVIHSTLSGRAVVVYTIGPDGLRMVIAK